MPTEVAVVLGAVSVACAAYVIWVVAPVVVRKCPLSRHGECQCTEVESGGFTWRPDCSGRSIRCKRRRRVLRDFPGDVSPDGDL